MRTARERTLVRVVGAGEPAADERAALLLDEQVALAAALPHLSDLRHLDHRDLHCSTDLDLVVRARASARKPASRA